MAIKHIKDADFEKEVLQSSKPVLVDFYADWCGPCKMLAPILEDYDSDMDGQIDIVKVNVDENQQVAAQLGVRGIPALFLFKDGEVVGAATGAMPKKDLAAWVSKTLGDDAPVAAPKNVNAPKPPKAG